MLTLKYVFTKCVWNISGVDLRKFEGNYFCLLRQDSSVDIVTSYGAGEPGLYSRQWKIFLLSTVSRTVLGPTQPPIQWILGTLFQGVNLPGREDDQPNPATADVKKTWVYTPPYIFMA
jgi:hypothetical protein